MKNQIRTAAPFLLVAVLVLIFSLISACTSFQATSPGPIIGSEKAIKVANSGCKQPHLVLVGDPKNIRTKLLSLEEADKFTKVEGETNYYLQPMNTKVWLVQMDGQLQLVGGPEPVITIDIQTETPKAPQPFSGTCIAVLDASSGDLIFVHYKR